MAYIDTDDFDTYYATYGGTDISDEDDFDELAELASLDVDTATFDRIVTFSDLTTFQQTQIKNAVCSHAQTLNDYGDSTSIIDDNRKISLGDLSVEQSANEVLDRMSARTKAFLNKTGLTNKSLSYSSRRGYWYNQ